MPLLLTVALKSKRDVLLARQRARQIAALLRYDPAEQACVAAGTFTVASHALRNARGAQLSIQIDKQMLHVAAEAGANTRHTLPLQQSPAGAPGPDSSLRLVKPLPAAAADFSSDDLIWVVDQLNQQIYFSPYEEVEHQNQEMLGLLHALHHAQAQLRQLQENRAAPSAA